jgi:hypothetical protein
MFVFFCFRTGALTLTGAALPVIVGRMMEGAKALLSKDATGAELRLGTPGMRDARHGGRALRANLLTQNTRGANGLSSIIINGLGIRSNGLLKRSSSFAG